MYEVSVETTFSASHFLKDYNGKCENLHGHNWKVKVTASSANINEQGIAIDFTILKQFTENCINQFDHVHLNEIQQFKHLNPTTENIARIIFDELSKAINNNSVRIKKVTVGETEGNYASYWK